MKTESFQFDFEELVEECFKAHIVPPNEFIHVRKNSKWDRNGIDFILKINNLDIKLQVKASRDKTIALYLPLTDEYKRLLSPRMRTRILKHFREYPDVPYFLFVAHVSEENPRDEIKKMIWQEITKLFGLMKLDNRLKLVV